MSITHHRSYLTDRASGCLFVVSNPHIPPFTHTITPTTTFTCRPRPPLLMFPCDLYHTYDRLRSSTVMSSSHQLSHFAAVPLTLSSLSYRFRPVTNTTLSDLTDQTFSTSYRIYLPKPNLANHQFARLRSPTQFATVQLLSSISVVLIFPIQMSGLWHRLLQLVIGYPVPWEEHADNVATAFYCRGLAQNITMVGFLGESFTKFIHASRHKGRLEIRSKEKGIGVKSAIQRSLPRSPCSLTLPNLSFPSCSPVPLTRLAIRHRPHRRWRVTRAYSIRHAELHFT